jgi:hypothetical protein
LNLGVFKRRIDVDAEIQMTPLKSLYASGDKNAHIFELSLYRGAEEMDLSGASAQGYFIRADGYTVPITGAISGNVVTLTITEGCYYVVGNFNLIIKVSTAESRKSVFWGNGYVVRSMTDAIVDEENVIPSLDELLAQISAAESAAKAANQAALAANSAATSAAQAASAADTNASAANSAANAATSAASAASAAATKIDDMTITATGLAAGAVPTVELTEVGGHYNIVLGLPKGDKGDPGATPQITVQVKTGEPGTAASVKQTGTAEAPVIDLTIPRGDTGSIGSLTINGKTPDGAGKVELTAADVGARADDWMPTAADVGALSGTDATLTQAGEAADAQKVGTEFSQLKAEKANKSIVSDAWQTGQTYEKGAYCIYNDNLFKASVQTSAEPGNDSDWAQCSVANELKAQGDTLNKAYVKEYFSSKLEKARSVTYPVASTGGYLVIAYNYASAAVFLVRGEGTSGFVHRIAPASDRNSISCKWTNSQLQLTSTDEASATVSIIRLY